MGALRKHQEFEIAEIIIFPFEQARPDTKAKRNEVSAFSKFMDSEFMDVVKFQVKAFTITGVLGAMIFGGYFAANAGKSKANINLTGTSYSAIAPQTDSVGFDWAQPGRYTR